MNRNVRRGLMLIASLAFGLSSYPSRDLRAAAQGSAPPLEFTRDIRPMLAEACFGCHGPSDSTRQAGLRLDTRDLLGKVVVPGDSARSLLFQRLSARDDGGRMPPASSGRSLTQAQIQAVRQWIDGGAAWGSDIGGAPVQTAERIVDFDREVRPILSENCFSCHGPDERTPAGAAAGCARDPGERGPCGGPVIVPGNTADSLLYRRIIAADDHERMPKGRARLTDEQTATVNRWIEQGATWETHWAFLPPALPSPARDRCRVAAQPDRRLRPRPARARED